MAHVGNFQDRFSQSFSCRSFEFRIFSLGIWKLVGKFGIDLFEEEKKIVWVCCNCSNFEGIKERTYKTFVEINPCSVKRFVKVLNLSQSSVNKLFEFSETRLLAISQSYTIGFQKKLDNRNSIDSQSLWKFTRRIKKKSSRLPFKK